MFGSNESGRFNWRQIPRFEVMSSILNVSLSRQKQGSLFKSESVLRGKIQINSMLSVRLIPSCVRLDEWVANLKRALHFKK